MAKWRRQGSLCGKPLPDVSLCLPGSSIQRQEPGPGLSPGELLWLVHPALMVSSAGSFPEAQA